MKKGAGWPPFTSGLADHFFFGPITSFSAA